MASDPVMASTHAIGDLSLKSAYSRLFETLSEFKIRSTFGIVGLFAQNIEAFQQFDSQNGTLNPYEDWFKYPRMSFRNGLTDGWFYPTLIEEIQQAGSHEIASHSYTHLPFHNESVSRDIIRKEFHEMSQFMETKGIKLKTIIYPRNQVSRTDLLTEFGIIGFRESSAKGSAYGSRMSSLINETNVFQKSEPKCSQGTPIPVPAGFFLNWRSGARLVIPPTVTFHKFNNLLNHAEKSGGVVHMWLHPHNLITGKNQFQLFTRVLKSVAQRQERGSLSVITMNEYCTQNPITKS